MPLPSPKELQKLANACRKAGIAHFKCGDVEFTLGLNPQPKVVKKTPNQTDTSTSILRDNPELSEQELLFWSSGQPVEAEAS